MITTLEEKEVLLNTAEFRDVYNSILNFFLRLKTINFEDMAEIQSLHAAHHKSTMTILSICTQASVNMRCRYVEQEYGIRVEAQRQHAQSRLFSNAIYPLLHTPTS